MHKKILTPINLKVFLKTLSRLKKRNLKPFTFLILNISTSNKLLVSNPKWSNIYKTEKTKILLS